MLLIVSLLLLLFISFLTVGLILSEPVLLGLLGVLFLGVYLTRTIKVFQMEKSYQEYQRNRPTEVQKKTSRYLVVNNPFLKVRQSPEETDVYVSGVGLQYWRGKV